MASVLYFDGLCEPINPGGIACCGYVIKSDGKLLEAGCNLAARRSTNNVAEYTALIRGLDGLVRLGIKGAVVRGDSQLVIRQMTGEYAVRASRILPLYERAIDLAQRAGVTRFEWVPRTNNTEADALSRRAYAAVVGR